MKIETYEKAKKLREEIGTLKTIYNDMAIRNNFRIVTGCGFDFPVNSKNKLYDYLTSAFWDYIKELEKEFEDL